MNHTLPSAGAPRTVLFLQGPPSPFWNELARAFAARGVRVLKVNFCSADVMFWRQGGAINYRGRPGKWPAFLADLIQRESVSDILYFSDRFPYHVAAQDIARSLTVKTHAVEFGYLRPGWLTLERGGMSAFSHFPDRPEAIRAIAAAAGPMPAAGAEPHKARTELFFEILYNLINEYWRVFFPFYRPGTFWSPTLEYLSGGLHRLRRAWNAKAQARKLAPFEAGERSFNLLALQLQSDKQILHNTSYQDQRVMLDKVIRSFARHAPPERHLLVKLHPLDPGMTSWRKLLRRLAQQHGVTGRVEYCDGGHLDALIAHASGVVVSNSTVGLTALRAGTPTIALGDAIYDMAGLTHQGPLDSFWCAPEPVDASLCEALVSAMAASIQVPGSLYERDGRAVGCEAVVSRVLGGEVNGHGAFVDPPPRLARRRVPFANPAL